MGSQQIFFICSTLLLIWSNSSKERLFLEFLSFFPNLGSFNTSLMVGPLLYGVKACALGSLLCRYIILVTLQQQFINKIIALLLFIRQTAIICLILFREIYSQIKNISNCFSIEFSLRTQLIIFIIQSTMSLLAQQLNKLKSQNALKIAPGAEVPTFILDKNTARNTTIEVLYTMAIMGFGELKKQLVSSGKNLGQQLLSEQYKDLNRNKLTAQENTVLSTKTTKFLLFLSPYFLNRSCQSIIEYLIRNFRVHTFQPEQLVLIFLQYWQHPLYSTLISNIDSKNPSLSFIKNIQDKKQVNFSYILKSITYSRNLLQNLMMLNRQLIKEESLVSEQIEIDLMNRKTMISKVVYQETSVVKNDQKQFLLKILQEIISKNMSGFIKDICEFCIFAAKQDDEEARNMSILLSISLLSNSQVSIEWSHKVINYLLDFDLSTNMFHFVIILSQRWPACFTYQILTKAISKETFLEHLSKFQGSKSMLFYLCYKYYFQKDSPNQSLFARILELIVLSIKEEEFLQAHETKFFSSLFQMTIEKQKELSKKKNKWGFIVEFIGKYLLYEYAIFLDNSEDFHSDTLLGKIVMNSNGRVNFKGIQKKRKPVQKHISIQQEAINSEMEEEGQEVNENKKIDSIIKIVNKACSTKYNKIEPSNQEQIKSISTVLQQYYSSSNSTLSQQQKNRLFQFNNIFQLYNQKYFKVDLNNHDYLSPIKYIMKTKQIQHCFQVFQCLIQNQVSEQNRKEKLSSIMYRELCRQAISKLAELAKQNYNKVVLPLGSLYQKFQKISTPETLINLHSLLLKISKGIFSVVGHKKGKFYKLIAIHSKMLATLNQSNLQKPHEIQLIYSELIKTFGEDNLYCFFIGCIDLIGNKEKSKKDLFKFMTNTMLPSLENQKQFSQLFQILISVEKLAVLSYQLIREQNQEDSDDIVDIVKEFKVSVAKKVILNFFGLQNSKNIRKIARKILLFISMLFKLDKFQALFKKVLEDINYKMEQKISKRCTNIYKLLTYIEDTTKGPINDLSSQMKNKIAQLFPLQLRIEVLGPLLPSEQVYKSLGEQLALHSHKKFDHLKSFTNILPEKLSKNYVKFIIECTKRGYLPSTEVCRQLLDDKYHEINSLSQIEFVCAMTQYGTQESLQFIEDIFNVIFRDCQDASQYSLAVFHQLVGNLREYCDPYLDQIFAIAIEVESQYTKKFVQRVADLFTHSSLLGIAKKHYKSVNNIKNFIYYLRKVSEKVPYESLIKIYHLFSSRAIKMMIVQEEDYTEINSRLAEVFIEMAMKMNENHLRKAIIEIVRFGSETTKEDSNAQLLFNSRKHLVMTIYTELQKKLGELFNHFYGYIFEEIIKDFGELSGWQASKKSNKDKRARDLSNYSVNCAISYVQRILECLLHLFENDAQNQFMDSIKFDALAPQLASLFSITKFGDKYSSTMTNYLHPCLISLYKNTQDDYKLKTLNTEILRMIRMKQPKVNIAIFEFMDRVIPEIDYRFLLFVDQLTPILIQFSDTRNSTIKKSVESIIYKIQNISGKKIENIVR